MTEFFFVTWYRRAEMSVLKERGSPWWVCFLFDSATVNNLQAKVDALEKSNTKLTEEVSKGAGWYFFPPFNFSVKILEDVSREGGHKGLVCFLICDSFCFVLSLRLRTTGLLRCRKRWNVSKRRALTS